MEQTICMTEMLPRFHFISDEAEKKWDYLVSVSDHGKAYTIVSTAAELASTAEYGLSEVDDQSLKLGIRSSGFMRLTTSIQLEVVKTLFEVWKSGELMRRWWNLSLQPWYWKRRGHQANARARFIINPLVRIK